MAPQQRVSPANAWVHTCVSTCRSVKHNNDYTVYSFIVRNFDDGVFSRNFDEICRRVFRRRTTVARRYYGCRQRSVSSRDTAVLKEYKKEKKNIRSSEKPQTKTRTQANTRTRTHTLTHKHERAPAIAPRGTFTITWPRLFSAATRPRVISSALPNARRRYQFVLFILDAIILIHFEAGTLFPTLLSVADFLHTYTFRAHVCSILPVQYSYVTHVSVL